MSFPLANYHHIIIDDNPTFPVSSAPEITNRKMYAFSTILMASASLLMSVGAVQVNFYYDRNCQNYAGSSYFSLASKLSVIGGPYGSSSAIWVNDDGAGSWCRNRYAKHWCTDSTCSDAIEVVAGNGKCHSDFTEMWAQINCDPASQ